MKIAQYPLRDQGVFVCQRENAILEGKLFFHVAGVGNAFRGEW